MTHVARVCKNYTRRLHVHLQNFFGLMNTQKAIWPFGQPTQPGKGRISGKVDPKSQHVTLNSTISKENAKKY